MATTKTLLPAPYLTLEDENGHAIIGGTVRFLDTGTAVLAVVYADANGLVISANPLTVDGAGRYSVWLTPGQVVDVEYRDALGALIKTVPGVMGSAGAAGNVDLVGVLGETVAYGQVVFLSDGAAGKTAGRWWLADFSQGQGAHQTVGLALRAGVAGATVAIRTDGRVDGLTGLVVGARYYLGATPGVPVIGPPIGLRVVGQADTPTALVLTPNPPDPFTFVDNIQPGGTIVQLPVLAETILLRGTVPFVIQGMRAGFHGQRVRLLAGPDVGQVDLVHQSPAAAPADRLRNFATSAPTSLAPGGVADYMWDQTLTAWKLTAHEQGGWIAPPFNATDYTGSAGETWAVTAGQLLVSKYYLQARALRVQVRVNGSTLGGALSAFVYLKIPGGFTAGGGPMAATFAAANPQLPPANSSPVWSPTGSQLALIPRQDGAVPWVAGGFSASLDLTVEVV